MRDSSDTLSAVNGGRNGRSLWDKISLGVIGTIVAAALVFAGRTIWATKVDVGDFNLHVATENHREQEHLLKDQLDSVWHAEQAARVEEILCAVKPNSRQCR